MVNNIHVTESRLSESGWGINQNSFHQYSFSGLTIFIHIMMRSASRFPFLSLSLCLCYHNIWPLLDSLWDEFLFFFPFVFWCSVLGSCLSLAFVSLIWWWNGFVDPFVANNWLRCIFLLLFCCFECCLRSDFFSYKQQCINFYWIEGDSFLGFVQWMQRFSPHRRPSLSLSHSVGVSVDWIHGDANQIEIEISSADPRSLCCIAFALCLPWFADSGFCCKMIHCGLMFPHEFPPQDVIFSFWLLSSFTKIVKGWLFLKQICMGCFLYRDILFWMNVELNGFQNTVYRNRLNSVPSDLVINICFSDDLGCFCSFLCFDFSLIEFTRRDYITSTFLMLLFCLVLTDIRE